MMRIDLNADVGESSGQDPMLMPHITSANVACGFHAGDPVVMRETLALAKEFHVAVGAHPGFPDREGFGRRDLHLSPREIEDLVRHQIEILAALAAEASMRLQHVKPHGALFNIAVRDRLVADAIARATADIGQSLILFGLPRSELIAAGENAGLPTAREAFADRAYRPDGPLVPRSEPGAVIHDPEMVLSRVVAMARDPEVDTICVHGDTPGAAALAARIRSTLVAAGIEVRALGSP